MIVKNGIREVGENSNVASRNCKCESTRRPLEVCMIDYIVRFGALEVFICMWK